jgi:hypothetical protein
MIPACVAGTAARDEGVSRGLMPVWHRYAAQASSANTYTGPATDTYAGPAADTCTGPGADTCTGPGADTCAGPGADTCTGPRSKDDLCQARDGQASKERSPNRRPPAPAACRARCLPPVCVVSVIAMDWDSD